MRLAALCSSGKDSTYAQWLASKNNHKIKFLVSLIPEREDSWMFHRPNPEIINLYSKTSGIPLKKKRTTGDKKKEIKDFKNVLRNLKIDGVVNGAVASNYQKKRIEKVCEELKIESLTPLWKKDPEKLLKNMLKEGLEIIITSISAKGLEKEWLGRKIEKESIEELKDLNQEYGIHITGEGGEYETLVLDAPFFKKRIIPVKTKKIWDGIRGKLKIRKAKLKEK